MDDDWGNPHLWKPSYVQNLPFEMIIFLGKTVDFYRFLYMNAGHWILTVPRDLLKIGGAHAVGSTRLYPHTVAGDSSTSGWSFTWMCIPSIPSKVILSWMKSNPVASGTTTYFQASLQYQYFCRPP